MKLINIGFGNMVSAVVKLIAGMALDLHKGDLQPL